MKTRLLLLDWDGVFVAPRTYVFRGAAPARKKVNGASQIVVSHMADPVAVACANVLIGLGFKIVLSSSIRKDFDLDDRAHIVSYFKAHGFDVTNDSFFERLYTTKSVSSRPNEVRWFFEETGLSLWDCDVVAFDDEVISAFPGLHSIRQIRTDAMSGWTSNATETFYEIIEDLGLSKKQVTEAQ